MALLFAGPFLLMGKMQKTIRIRYLPGAHAIELSDAGNWIDLYTYRDTVLIRGEMKRISLGFAMEMPAGYEAHIVPRSSTFQRYGVLQANSVGIIDDNYCGDNDIWAFQAYATRDVFIPGGTRVCQFRFVPTMLSTMGKIAFEAVDTLGNMDRGGFGSTGI